jgi:hypothetical protein
MATETTVTEVLAAAMDSVDLINGVNGGSWDVAGMSQTKINELVQRNVEHLEIILEFTDPNVKGSSNSKKTNCTSAIATGKSYISNNS